jgi:hypothetical protein
MESKFIDVKLLKEKDAKIFTFIGGLGNFMEIAEIKQLVKKIEDLLGIKMIKRKNGDELESGFEGDNREKIRNFLLDNFNIENKENIIRIEEQKKEKEKKDDISMIDKINKKISLYYVKDKRAKRTYIMGLKHFINNEELQNLSKKLQKSMGTNSFINEEGECGFNGDYTNDTAKKSIIKECVLTNTTIGKELFDF